MTNLDHDDLQDFIPNLIDDAIGAPAQPVPFLTGEFFAPRGAEVFSQLLKAFQDAPDVFCGESPKIFGHGFFKRQGYIFPCAFRSFKSAS